MGLSRRAAVVASGRAATTASVLAVNALLSRAWPPEVFGHFSAIWILGNTLVPLFLLGIPGALLYALPRRPSHDRGQLLRQVSGILLLSALALCALLWLGGPYLATRIDGLPPRLFSGQLLPFLPYLFCLVAGAHGESALVAAGRYAWQAWISLLGSLVLVGAAGLAFHGGWSVGQTFTVLSAGGAVRLVLVYAAVLRLALPKGVRSPSPGQKLGAFLRYALTIGAGDALGSLSRSVDRLVVLILLDPTRLGIYHLGAIEVPVSLVLASLVTVMVPEVSRLMAAGAHAEVADLFRTAVSRLAWMILPLFFFLFVFAADVIALYLPAAYAHSAGVFRCFLLMLPLRCAVYNPILVGSGRAAWAMAGATADLVINAALSVFLVLYLRQQEPAWALLAPAAASVIATWVQVGGLLLALSRLLRRRLSQLVPWGHLLRVSLWAATGAWASYRLASWGAEGPAGRLGIGAVTMVLLAWGLPALTCAEDRRQLHTIFAALRRRGGT